EDGIRDDLVTGVRRVLFRSCLVNAAGPLVFSPSSLRCRAMSRPASAFPIFASVHCLPVGETTRALFLRQRDASGMSEVTHTSARSEERRVGERVGGAGHAR